jgi:hypothetical protein
MERMDTIVLEDARGRWPHRVNWIAAFRPIRVEHEGRTFDAAGIDDGVWVYRTTQPPPPGPKTVMVRLERGEARAFVAGVPLREPLPDVVEHDGVTFTRKGTGSDGIPQYWHG